MTCVECRKPRCVYSRKQLSSREERTLNRLLERYLYTCGSVIPPDGINHSKFYEQVYLNFKNVNHANYLEKYFFIKTNAFFGSFDFFIFHNHLQGSVFVRLQLACTTPVEMAYYSANAVARKDLCCYCASTNTIQRDHELDGKYRVVLPMRIKCINSGRNYICRLPKKN